MNGPALLPTRKEWNIIILGALVGLLVVALLNMRKAEAQVAGPPCIYEVLVSGDKVTVGWTTPPCDANLDPRNPAHHAVFYHASVNMAACGAIAIYRWSNKNVPVADTVFSDEKPLCPPLGLKVTEEDG